MLSFESSTRGETSARQCCGVQLEEMTTVAEAPCPPERAGMDEIHLMRDLFAEGGFKNHRRRNGARVVGRPASFLCRTYCPHWRNRTGKRAAVHLAGRGKGINV